jgi:hypothetical protein
LENSGFRDQRRQGGERQRVSTGFSVFAINGNKKAPVRGFGLSLALMGLHWSLVFVVECSLAGFSVVGVARCFMAWHNRGSGNPGRGFLTRSNLNRAKCSSNTHRLPILRGSHVRGSFLSAKPSQSLSLRAIARTQKQGATVSIRCPLGLVIWLAL